MEHDDAVALARCDDYRGENVQAGVSAALELLGGVERFAAAGQSIFIKVNAVTANDPATAIVSHPEVARAVIQQFQRVTDRITVGDSPGGPFTPALLKRVYEKTGLARVAAETGAQLGLDTETVDLRLPQGKMIKRLTLCRPMVEADVLISISKFKTHRYMNITGPIKNLYGAVPGVTKFIYHSRFEDEREFADLIVDVHLACDPELNIADAVEIIDGDGSRHGSIRNMKAIGASANAFALESQLLQMAGLVPADSKPLAAAIVRGVCPSGTGWFDTLGEDPAALHLNEFRLPGKNLFSERVPARIAGRFSRLLAVTPRPLPDKCTGCGKCAGICPREAITMRNGLAVVDSSKCIRCFCCDELCEQQAIGMKVPLLMRLKRA
jgi:uncharacterized protein (DUF362 family)/Pyruvate/2-oxoacid:ferredoxin oxidoreductase delta subunit